MSCFHIRRCMPLLLVCALVSFSARSRAQTVDWDLRVTPFNQVFPALDLSQAPRAHTRQATSAAHALGDGSGLIALRLRAQRDNERVRVVVAAEQWLSSPTDIEFNLEHAGEDYELHPLLEWNPQRLAAQIAPVNASLQFSVQRDGRAAGERVLQIDLRPLNDALYFVRDGRDTVDLSWIFAAYANENDAVVDRVLDSAMQSGIVNNFSGYADAGDDAPVAEAVLRQVWAIWYALNARGIRYSGADPGIDRGPRVFSQRVRFLVDTWNDRSANCIDGSVLLVSALQRIGLRSFLVLVPGHAFAGFYTDAGSHHAAYLETTLLGDRLAPPRELPAYAATVVLREDTSASLASFDAALRAGALRHARSADKLDGRHRPDYAIIDIATAREFGIRPIALPVQSVLATGR